MLNPKPYIRSGRNWKPSKAKVQSNSIASQGDVGSSVAVMTPEISNSDACAADTDLNAVYDSGGNGHPPDVRRGPPPQVCTYHPGHVAYKVSSFPRLTGDDGVL